KEHWAADSVRAVVDAGIMKGYPDDTYKGDKPVTRYELAAALQRMVEFIQGSQKPVATDKQETSVAPKYNWGKDSVAFLKINGFVSADSSLLKDATKPVSEKEMADALASVAAKLIENKVPAPESPDSSAVEN
ncbi:S-layer homology domain-containing protein, partial [bacterium]|nr:S-layer homology domain-containing protein [bacterium]